ncbi:MAG: hypothetical protein JNL74_02790, partial [Fibrobacteres bacterium]|nr:hypothetical protein [Fibrobacterota bacterium]
TEKLEKALQEFVNNGGTIVCESECGAFTPQGFYRYPEDRFTVKLTGAAEVGRRTIDKSISVKNGKSNFTLEPYQWLTPLKGGKPTVFASHKDGALTAEYTSGKGRVIFTGSYFAEPYLERWNSGFEELVSLCCSRAHISPSVFPISPKKTAKSFLYIKTGVANGRKVIFLFFPEGSKKGTISVNSTFIKSGKVSEIISGKKISGIKKGKDFAFTVESSDLRTAILIEE